MKIQMAHVRIDGLSVAIFGANATDNTDRGRDDVLARLTASARRNGLRVDKSVLVYGGNRFHGTPDLVRFLSSSGGRPAWTHTIDDE